MTVLKSDTVLQRSGVMPEMKGTGRPVSGEDDGALVCIL
jgi:hypothetical protein